MRVRKKSIPPMQPQPMPEANPPEPEVPQSKKSEAEPIKRMVEVDPSHRAIQAEAYRGIQTLRWKFEINNGKPRVTVAAQCKCGKWWGWAHEDRREELLQLVGTGCPGCKGSKSKSGGMGARSG